MLSIILVCLLFCDVRFVCVFYVKKTTMKTSHNELTLFCLVLIDFIQKIVQNRKMDVKFDKHSLIIDGKRTFLRCGAFHYFRTPGYELARDRFSKMKAAGYNAVDIYFYCQSHSKKRGEYDFEGVTDVRKVLEAAREVGLYVVARPAPCIDAEVKSGGVPLWYLLS